MHRFPGILLPFLALAASFPAAIPSYAAESGTGELSFDRPAITALIRGGMPGALNLPIPGVGNATLRLRPPGRVDFREGGIETTIGFTLAELRLSGALHLRYVPESDPETGTVSLVAESAVPQEPVSLPIDLAPFLPPARIPPAFQWRLGGPADNPGTLTVYVRELRVEKDRLVIAFHLVTDRGE
jgi:hypothetical protein